MARTTHRTGDDPRPRKGRIERFLLSVMGPADVGDPNAPVTFRPDDSTALCDRCGQPWDRHERVQSSVTYLTCPE